MRSYLGHHLTLPRGILAQIKADIRSCSPAAGARQRLASAAWRVSRGRIARQLTGEPKPAGLGHSVSPVSCIRSLGCRWQLMLAQLSDVSLLEHLTHARDQPIDLGATASSGDILCQFFGHARFNKLATTHLDLVSGAPYRGFASRFILEPYRIVFDHSSNINWPHKWVTRDSYALPFYGNNTFQKCRETRCCRRWLYSWRKRHGCYAHILRCGRTDRCTAWK